MFRGCQKKIIVLKNTGSDMFDEAYFILRESAASCASITQDDMIAEANRIVAANQLSSFCSHRARALPAKLKYYIAGAGSCGVIVAIAAWLGVL